MKKLATLFVATFFMALGTTSMAQSTCCSGTTTAPEVSTGFHGTAIPLDANTPAPTLSTNASSDLPTIEYLVTKRNTPALDAQGQPDTTGGGGDVIIGADMDGIFQPNSMTRYGVTLQVGDTFDITAVGYDIAVIKTLADSLLNGYSGATPCCGLFVLMAQFLNEPALAGFCDSVRAAGINGAADINGMNDVLTIFDGFSTGQTSVGSMIWTLQTINTNGGFISADCGGTGATNFVPYGVNGNQKYGYEVDQAVAVQKLSDVSLFMMYPNPTQGGDVQVYFTTSKNIDLSINVYDALGQRVYNQTLGNVSGDFTAQIPVSNLASGLYHVELTDGHSNQTTKLIVK